MGEITACLMERRGDGEGVGGGSSAPLLLRGDLRVLPLTHVCEV